MDQSWAFIEFGTISEKIEPRPNISCTAAQYHGEFKTTDLIVLT